MNFDKRLCCAMLVGGGTAWYLHTYIHTPEPEGALLSDDVAARQEWERVWGWAAGLPSQPFFVGMN